MEGCLPCHLQAVQLLELLKLKLLQDVIVRRAALRLCLRPAQRQRHTTTFSVPCSLSDIPAFLRDSSVCLSRGLISDCLPQGVPLQETPPRPLHPPDLFMS